MTLRRFLAVLLCVLACAVSLVWLHCRYIHCCYRLSDLQGQGTELAATCAALDARVSQLRQPHLVARRVESWQLGLVSAFEELPAEEPVRLAQVGLVRGMH